MGLEAIATRLIKRYGEAGEIERPGVLDDSVYPAVMGEPTLHPATIAVVSYGVEDRKDGIGVDSLRALVSVEGLAIEPENTDRLRVAGRTYQVVSVDHVTRNGAPLFYDLEVVRS